MTAPLRRGRLILAGLGNIGSHVVPLVARMPEIDDLVLVDAGRYDAANLAAQAIDAGDLGAPKVRVQRRRVGEARPGLRVHTFHGLLEDVPLGWLRGSILLTCLDTRLARMRANQAVFRLGIPWIDAGVHADGWLVRVSVVLPRPSAACLECTWDEADYAAIEQAHACGEATGAVATAAPASLGALAASLQVIECQHLLAGRRETAGHHIVLDARSHRLYRTSSRQSPACRLIDHAPLAYRALAGGRSSITLEDTLVMDAQLAADPARRSLAVPGHVFVRPWCQGCQRVAASPVLSPRMRLWPPRCERCGAVTTATGWQTFERLDADPNDILRRWPLTRLGLRRGELFAICEGDQVRHYLYEGACRVEPPDARLGR